MALTAERLNATPCSCCGLTHQEHPEPFVLQGRCHPDAALHITHVGGELRVACSICSKPVATLEVPKEPRSRVVWTARALKRNEGGVTVIQPSCHTGGSKASYKLGVVTLECATCRRPYARAKVA